MSPPARSRAETAMSAVQSALDRGVTRALDGAPHFPAGGTFQWGPPLFATRATLLHHDADKLVEEALRVAALPPPDSFRELTLVSRPRDGLRARWNRVRPLDSS